MTALAAPPRPVVSLDDILLELIDIGDNVRDDVGDLDELAASIAEIGVLDPVKVTRQPDGRYRLVWGQRRVLASQKAGQLRIAAIIEPPSDIDAKGARRSIEQLSENLQRKDLNDIEEAVALRDVLDGNPDLTQAALAQRLGRHPSWVANTLRLLETAPEVQARVRKGELTGAHAKAIAGLDVDIQAGFAKTVVASKWSAHETERQAKWAQENAQRTRERRAAAEELAQVAIKSLEKAVSKDAVVLVSGDQAVADAIKAAGWKNAKIGGYGGTGSWEEVKGAGACGCKAWVVNAYYAPVSVRPACVDSKHIAERRKKRDAERVADREKNARQQKADAAKRMRRGDALVARFTETPSDPFAQRLTLYALLEDGNDENVIERYLDGQGEQGDRADDDLWRAILACPDDKLGLEIGRAVGEVVFGGWRSLADVVAAVDAWAPPEPKPARAKKAAKA